MKKGVRKLKRLLVVLNALALVAGFSAPLYAGIEGSAHDLSDKGYSGGRICVVCHAPHFADTSVTDAPLWNHEVTTASYTLYSSASFDGSATIVQPFGGSKLCLSCHDGTVAVDAFGGATGSDFIGADYNLGTDLSDDHPISFKYDTALSTTDGGLYDPSTEVVTIGEGGDRLQCSACHSVHNDFVAGGIQGEPLLKITKADSALCLACHIK
jgi:hypothetical protein